MVDKHISVIDLMVDVNIEPRITLDERINKFDEELKDKGFINGIILSADSIQHLYGIEKLEALKYLFKNPNFKVIAIDWVKHTVTVEWVTNPVPTASHYACLAFLNEFNDGKGKIIKVLGIFLSNKLYNDYIFKEKEKRNHSCIKEVSDDTSSELIIKLY